MSHPQYATYGLPRYVLTFLCHMESHKDCLKWNIVEGSHKLTLTLTWNFRKNKIKETLWEKLQRTIKLGRSSKTDVREDSGPLAVPRTVSRFIKRSAQELPEIRPYKTSSAAADDDDGHSGVTWGTQRAKDKQSHHHHHHWSKLSSQSLPGKLASSGVGGGPANMKNSVSRQHFISTYSSYHNLPSRMSRGGGGGGGMPDDASPFHGSWPGVSFDASSEAVEHSTPTATTPDMTSRSVQPSPSSSTNRQSSSGGGCYRDNSAACSKAGDDDDYLADDLTEKSSEGPGGGGGGGGGSGPGSAGGAANFLAGGGGPGTRKHHHSRLIVGDGWNNRAAEADFWPRLHLELLDETLVASGYGTDDAIEMGADGGGADAGGDGSDGRLVNETVLKCLDSCDKILFRHSTTIT